MSSGLRPLFCALFFFNDTATTEIYTLSLHDALPDLGDNGPHLPRLGVGQHDVQRVLQPVHVLNDELFTDRKSTRLNSSHGYISYAVFCLKKKKPRSAPLSHNTAIPYCVMPCMLELRS